MADRIDALIENLEIWETGDYGYDAPSLREKATDELKALGADTVLPPLISRLKELLTATAKHRERSGEVLKVWRIWYDEMDALSMDYDTDDIEHHLTVRSADLPQPTVEDDNFRDPVGLKQGIVEALRQIGDERAAPVLHAALADRACVHSAARALRDIRSDQAIPALLDAVTLVGVDDTGFREVLATLRTYDVDAEQAHRRLQTETTPEGRIRLWHLVKELSSAPPDAAEIHEALVYAAMESGFGRWRWLRLLEAETSDDAPPPVVIREAIEMAANGRPAGYDRDLRRMIRYLDGQGEAEVAAVAVGLIAEQSPESEAATLYFAMELARHASQAPMDLTLGLYRLTSHEDAKVRHRARRALHAGRRLYDLMRQSDPSLREEAQRIFEETATAEDREHAAWLADLDRPGWRRLLGRLKPGRR